MKRNLIENWKLNREVCKLESYFLLCNNGILINKKKYKKVYNPKISIITTIYNREKFILRFLRSIQNQFFDEIEIIFIDDFSKDNSSKIIENYKNEDERIILIRHKKNKGTLISRNIGVLFSKGNFIIIPDSDDILSNKILQICYKASIRNNYEMIRFNQYEQKTKGEGWMKVINKLGSHEIYQPQLSIFMFYGLGYLKLNDFSISNKFIKRDLFIKALDYINKYYLNQYMILFEDGIINYSLYRNAKSFYLIKKIGYYYFYNNKSITQSRNININKNMNFLFLYLRFIFENTKNNYFEKDMSLFLINKYINNINILFNITYQNELYIEILKKYIICKFIETNNKIKIKKMIEIIKNIIN